MAHLNRLVLLQRAVAAALLALAFGLVWAVPAWAAPTSVSSEAELRAALEAGSDVVLAQDFGIGASIEVPGSYHGTIDGAGHTLTATADLTALLVAGNGGSLTLSNVNLDGAERSRHIRAYGAAITIEGSSFINGSSKNDPKNAEGGSIYLTGGSLKVNESAAADAQNPGGTTLFARNATVAHRALSAGSVPHGGAIYANGAQVIMRKATFQGNASGRSSLQGDGGGCGGGIYLDGRGTYAGDSNLFEGNGCFKATDAGGNQGGAIFSDGVTLRSANSTFKVGRNVNTGGAIYTRNAFDSAIDRATFLIDQDDRYVVSGGAIQLDVNNSMTITNSTFTQKRGQVAFAGGFVNVVGKVDLSVRDTTMTGVYEWTNDNTPFNAKFGGAVCFEGVMTKGPDGAWRPQTTGSAVFQNVSISKVGATNAGGAISIGTGMNSATGMKVQMIDSSIKETGTIWQFKNTFADTEAPLDDVTYDPAGNPVNHANAPNFVGGQIYVGLHSSLSVSGGLYDRGASVRGGLVFNQGDTVVSDHAVLRQGLTNARGGDWSHRNGQGDGIFNAGTLLLDEVALSDHGNPWGGGHQAFRGGLTAYTGRAVYAYKPIDITPHARIQQDVRVIDGQSWINVRGALSTVIPVSVSETAFTPTDEWAAFSERAHRHLGYVVARGAQGYTLTPADAQRLHYVTREQGVTFAAVDDHAIPAAWDYVLNPSHEAVLGQRTLVTFHGNRNDGDPEQVTFHGQTSDDPTHAVTHTLYSENPADRPYVDPATMGPVDAVEPDRDSPVRPLHGYLGWFSDPDEGARYPFHASDPFGVGEVASGAIVAHPDIHIYAGWKRVPKVDLTKLWGSAVKDADRTPVTLVLTAAPSTQALPAGATVPPIEFWQDGTTPHANPASFALGVGEVAHLTVPDAVYVYGSDKRCVRVPLSYEVTEPNPPAGFTARESSAVLPSGADPDADAPDAVTPFSLTNESASPDTVAFHVSKAWAGLDGAEGSQPRVPESVTVRLMADGSEVDSVTLSEENGWEADFNAQPIRDDQGRLIQYTVREDSVDGYWVKVEAERESLHKGSFTVTNTAKRHAVPSDPPSFDRPVLPIPPESDTPPPPPTKPEPTPPTVKKPAAALPVTGEIIAVGAVVALGAVLAAAIAFLVIAARKRRK
ncbi:Cna B-type domain-containing protein [Berryella wangjianweii]|uniref:Cna B-type domain-containing protein n=1 Tax=Berryella wangjianweii TaxID=2734634 RepID=A0A6M8J207_9ACTN|nr:Cna B-type domain-containing protein [Berryella wangjianweii]QKF07587.1 Cna B-type domain-containing protein [Berryella wangjianweii]